MDVLCHIHVPKCSRGCTYTIETTYLNVGFGPQQPATFFELRLLRRWRVELPPSCPKRNVWRDLALDSCQYNWFQELDCTSRHHDRLPSMVQAVTIGPRLHAVFLSCVDLPVLTRNFRSWLVYTTREFSSSTVSLKVDFASPHAYAFSVSCTVRWPGLIQNRYPMRVSSCPPVYDSNGKFTLEPSIHLRLQILRPYPSTLAFT